jgi:hypothetical protein
MIISPLALLGAGAFLSNGLSVRTSIVEGRRNHSSASHVLPDTAAAFPHSRLWLLRDHPDLLPGVGVGSPCLGTKGFRSHCSMAPPPPILTTHVAWCRSNALAGVRTFPCPQRSIRGRQQTCWRVSPAKALFANARSSRPRSKARNTGQSTAARPVSSWTKKKTRRPSNLKASEKSGDRTAAHSPRRDHRPAERLGAGERSRSFYAVPGCGGWFDMRDLGWALEHAGPLPHPARDKSQ